MSSKHISGQNGKPTPTVAIWIILLALWNYENSRLCFEHLENTNWWLNQLLRFVCTAHWGVSALYLSDGSRFLPPLLRLGLCSWHCLVLLAGHA